MKIGVALPTLGLVALVVLVPSTCMAAPASVGSPDLSTPYDIICTVGARRTVVTLPLATAYQVLDQGKACRQEFVTIFDKAASEEQVAAAFAAVRPFFQALSDTGMTTYTADELSVMYNGIRDRIKEQRQDGPRTLGGWNGVPTPIWANVGCGLVSISGPAVGFTLGTHTLIPTIGADLFTVWMGQGETMSLGGFGLTTSTGPEFGLIVGFVGIMIALPIMIVGFLFQVGGAGLYLGMGPAPF